MDNGFRKKNICPYCAKACDRAIEMDNPKSKPEPGCLSICLGCVKVSQFDKNLNLIKFNENELSLEDSLDINRMKKFIRLGKSEYKKLN